MNKEQDNHIEREAKLWALFLIIALLILYLQMLWFDFITFDDGIYVTDNPHVKTGLSIKDIIWAFKSMDYSNWHPLTWISHMLDYEIYNEFPGGHHLGNLIFHIANTLLLFLFLRKSTGRLYESLIVTTLFALHPLRVESVAWISERKDLLCGFFWYLTSILYINWTKAPSIKRYLLVITAFSLGIISKPMIISLPLVLILIDYWPLKRTDKIFNRRIWTEKIPLFILSAFLGIITYLAQLRGGAVTDLNTLPFNLRLWNASISYLIYIKKILFPQALCIFYPHPGRSISLSFGIMSLIFLIILSALFIYKRRDYPYLFVGWLWFLITLFPVIGIVQVGGQAYADRYTYLSSIGIYILLVWGIRHCIETKRIREGLFMIFLSLYIVYLSLFTFDQLSYWKNSKRVFRHCLLITSKNYVAHMNLGVAYLKERNWNGAYREFNEAINIWPKYLDALNNLGVCLLNMERRHEAIEIFKKVLSIRPTHMCANMNLGNIYLEKGDISSAIFFLKRALEQDPQNIDILNSLGVAYLKAGRYWDAFERFQKITEINPQNPFSWNNLGYLMIALKRYEDGISFLDVALRLKEDFPEAHNNMGIALFNLSHLEDAIYHFSAALYYDRNYQKARENLLYAIRRYLEESNVFEN